MRHSGPTLCTGWKRGESWLTDLIYFDTDCLSAFLWVKEEKILTSLYSGRIMIPQQVYNEFTVPHLKQRADTLINSGDAVLKSIMVSTPEFSLYSKLTSNPDAGHSIIGKGEAAALALASAQSGIVASNNLKDVVAYVTQLALRHITTGDIMIEAYKASLITESDGNTIWSAMLAKRRRIGAATFSDYLNSHAL